jgi:TRAP-type transport system periplasmic protein
MEKDGLLTTHEFKDREQLLELAGPVMEGYAEELGALEVYKVVRATQ